MPESNNQTSWLNEKYTKLMNDFISQYWEVSSSQKMQIYRKFYDAQVAEEKRNAEDNATKELIEKWANSKDPKFRNTCNSQVNIKQIVNAIKDKTSQDPNFEYDLSDCDDNAIMSWYFWNNPKLSNELNNVIACKSDLTTFLQSAWLEKSNTKESSWWLSTWGAFWLLWWIAAWATALGTAILGSDTMGKIADFAYSSTIWDTKRDKDIKEVRKNAPWQIEDFNNEIARREKLIEEINNNPEYSEWMKKSATEQLNKEISSLRESIKLTEQKLEWSKMPLSSETAYEYWVKWTTTDAIWRKAADEADKLWAKWVKLKLDSSKETVNLRQILDDIDVTKLAKDNNDLGKFEEALEMFKQAYKDPEYTKMSMAQANNFKSNLYDKIPASAWEGKEVQNAYKRVIEEIAKWVKVDSQEKLTKEFWEDVAKLYADWANLHNFSELTKMEWIGKNKFFQSWVFSKVAAWIDTLLTPALSEGWYALKKANEAIKWAWKKIVEWAKNLVSTAKENPVETLKSWAKWAKWLLRENALFAVWEDLVEWARESIDSWYLGKSTALFSNKATKEEATEWLKDEWFVKYLRDTWMNPDKIIKDMWLNEKEINKALDTQKKLETKSKQTKIQGSTVKWKLKTELENANKVNPQLKKTTALKNQKNKVTTKKKSGK